MPEASQIDDPNYIVGDCRRRRKESLICASTSVPRRSITSRRARPACLIRDSLRRLLQYSDTLLSRGSVLSLSRVPHPAWLTVELGRSASANPSRVCVPAATGGPHGRV